MLRQKGSLVTEFRPLLGIDRWVQYLGTNAVLFDYQMLLICLNNVKSNG
jgi:hypothetical protein